MGQLNLQIATRRDDTTLKAYFETPGSSAKRSIVQNILNFITSLSTGTELGPSGSAPSVAVSIEGQAVAATATITQTSTGAANTQTLNILNVTFTAKTSGAAAGAAEWNRSNTVATSATNLAAAINGYAAFSGIVTASASAGVVTITAAQKGLMGNGLYTANIDCANTTVVSFASGAADPTALTLSF